MTKFTDTLTSQIQTATTAVNDANDRMLDAVVEANRNAVDFAVKSADRVPAVELPVELPFEIPTAAQAGERYIDFVERAVSLNRELNDRVIAMLPTEIKPTAAKVAAKPAAKPASKTAAKSTAKKAAAKK